MTYCVSQLHVYIRHITREQQVACASAQDLEPLTTDSVVSGLIGVYAVDSRHREDQCTMSLLQGSTILRRHQNQA